MSDDVVDTRLSYIKDLQNISIPEISHIYKMETNKWYLEEFTKKMDTHLEFLSTSELNKIVEKINPCIAWYKYNSYVKLELDKVTGTYKNLSNHKYSEYNNDVFNIDFDNNIIISLPLPDDVNDKIICTESRYFFIEIRLYGGYISENRVFLVFDKLNKEAFILDPLSVLKQKFYEINTSWINDIFKAYVNDFNNYKYENIIYYGFNKNSFIKEHIKIFLHYVLAVNSSVDINEYLELLDKINSTNQKLLSQLLEVFNVWFYFEHARNNPITIKLPPGYTNYINPFAAPEA